MIDAGILDGDQLVVHLTAEAVNRQIVVARIGDEVTVKRFKKRGALVGLIAEHRAMSPIVVDTRRRVLVIEGLVGLIRDGIGG